ncbi:MAG TPA: hypothetical protein VKU00_32645 [Chthonomonadaceae bacterium]|nr:hypothetical protein [Chthonomonadaceae bacterium]
MKKVLSATALFSLIVWGCTALSGLLHAQSSDQDTAQPAASAGQTLNDESLKQMLENMGYEPKKLTKGYLIVLKQDSWTLNMQIVLSGDTEKMGLNANLGKVEDPSGVSASQWMDLLISNGDIDPSAFYFDKDQKKLYLHRSFDNRAVTPAVLRKQIENFADNIRKTEALWKFTK